MTQNEIWNVVKIFKNNKSIGSEIDQAKLLKILTVSFQNVMNEKNATSECRKRHMSSMETEKSIKNYRVKAVVPTVAKC